MEVEMEAGVEVFSAPGGDGGVSQVEAGMVPRVGHPCAHMQEVDVRGESRTTEDWELLRDQL